MQLNQQFQEIAEKYKRENEKYEVYPYVFKYTETDEEFYYYILYKKYQEGKGMLVLSSNRGLLNKQEGVEIAYFFLTHNGTAIAATNVIKKVMKRSKKYVEELIQLLQQNKSMLFPVQSSVNIIINTLKIQAKNTILFNDIYQSILEIDNEIYDRSKTLTKELWLRGRSLIKKYDGLIYSEFNYVFNNLHHAEKIITYLNDKGNFILFERFKAKRMAKKLEKIFGKEAKANLIKSLEGFEKDFQGNFFTKTRGELSTDEYVQFIHQMAENDYKRNLLRDCRNP
ncbi:hypothetical protein NST89_02250 [Caldifermentibacillus hisashii]|uniref:hypothetical protein n=1 Tax=Caldifermentibacillus hisashii TaxID=996558 RepID=UPI0031361C33